MFTVTQAFLLRVYRISAWRHALPVSVLIFASTSIWKTVHPTSTVLSVIRASPPTMTNTSQTRSLFKEFVESHYPTMLLMNGQSCYQTFQGNTNLPKIQGILESQYDPVYQVFIHQTGGLSCKTCGEF